MMKQAWKSYLASLHSRNLRKIYHNGEWLFWLYWLVIYPAIIGMTSEDTTEYVRTMYTILIRLIPFLIMEWSNTNSKYLMTKMMFLIPMKEEQRKEYINDVLVIKIGVSSLCGMIIEVVYSIFYGFSFWRMILISIANVSIGISSYISVETFGKLDEKRYAILQDKIGIKKTHRMHWLAHFCSVMVIAALSILDIGAEESLAFVCKLLIGIMVIGLVIFDIRTIQREYQATIALAGNYELAFRIPGKVEKPEKFDLFAKK